MAFMLSFLMAGIILVLGFLGDHFFKKTGIPDVLVLLFLGFLIGPVLGIIHPSSFSSTIQLFASLALVIILFDGGLNLNLHRVLRGSPRATLLAFSGMIMSMVFTAAFVIFVMNWDLISGLFLGAIVGGTSSSIVLPIVSRMKINDKVQTTLSLESVFTDALVVVVGIALLQILTSSPNGNEISMISSGIASQFSIGIVMGIIVGAVWLNVLKIIEGHVYDDMVTLAMVLLFFSITESLGGNGAIFALIFGMMLGNGKEIYRMLRIRRKIEATVMMKKFQSEASFFMRTFFFVYLGLIISFSDISIVLYGVAISVLLLFGRYIAAFVTSLGSSELSKDRLIIAVMLPRGLAAAILAQVAASSVIPNASMYSDIIITVIVSTVLIASIGSFILAGRGMEKRNSKNQK